MRKIFKPFTILLISIFLFGMLAPLSPAFAKQEPPRAYPALLQMAQERPNEMVRVIVQFQKDRELPEQALANAGGKINKRLRMINGFSAEMPARAVEGLAHNPNVRWISLDAPVFQTVAEFEYVSSYSDQANVQSVGATKLWQEPYYLKGDKVTVAVVDSGISPHVDFVDRYGNSRLLASVNFQASEKDVADLNGHGTHVAGIIAGDGSASYKEWRGVAPNANLINLKVSNVQGMSLVSDVLEALEWAYNNKDVYNIRVVNLSLNSAVPEPYHLSPLSAAVEVLWFNGIVVVVSAGNNGTGAGPVTVYPPANDPFVITVGAADDKGTAWIADDSVGTFSAYGTTEDGFTKPDIVAPGRNIISTLASTNADLYLKHPSHRVNFSYFRMSGTSMAAPVVSGAAALLLQDEPYLTPDQVKFRLMATANRNWAGYDPATSGAGYLDAYAAVLGTTTESANTGLTASKLLWYSDDAATWGSVSWNSVSWNSVSWNSVSWNSVSWNSVSWNSVAWNSSLWDPEE